MTSLPRMRIETVVIMVVGGVTSLLIGIAELISSPDGWDIARSIVLVVGGAVLLSLSPLLWRRRLR